MTYHPPHITRFEVEIPGAPEAELHLAPKAASDLETILRYASERDMPVQVWGGGNHSGYGSPVDPALVISLQRLTAIEVWEPDDLTLVVEAGASVAEVEESLNERHQTLAMPEHPGTATIGGVIAAGVNGLRRGRLYSTRERLLETTVVTGDGRTVRSGGRVVKNVTGYDLHRLSFGAFGSLGVIVSVCLRLWPHPPAGATVRVDDLETAAKVVRPLAVLEGSSGVEVFLWGTEAEVEAQADRLGGDSRSGLHWPHDPADRWRWSLRVPPALTTSSLERLPDGWAFLANHGVGEVRLASPGPDGATEIRDWAESVGGALVVTAGDGDFEPWGRPPVALDLQKKLIGQFDPKRILNRGRLPGGL